MLSINTIYKITLTLVSPVDPAHFVPVLQDFFLLLQLSPGEAQPQLYPVLILIKYQNVWLPQVHTQILPNCSGCCIIHSMSCLTVSSISSFSSRATNGHQPFTRFCLKMEIVGSSCSFRIMSREHCLAVLAPRGNRFRSSSIAPGWSDSK